VGKLQDLALELEEQGIPDEVYREATVGDALRMLNADNIELVKVNGEWVRVDEKNN
jgi:hypothetical protein